ncbi:LysR family transcriptional regulator [Variovorax sp.]|uniref:LysR family transcriptional regulator n=1 Tax=Variovorax sp. TaxID=1871043 RepID=UPI00138557FC|nr:LysR family transcriptional regulator [Variovorax sp.]KAF1071817.1 MAG: HTH-type transcriptional regulator CynR [Variovorax sp.]
MKVDMLGLQAFLAVAEHGSFHAGADSLHITSTALTRRLQNLEAVLGVQLVERTTRSLALTVIGQNFLPQARRLLADISSAMLGIREAGQASRGNVTLACVPTVGVQFLPAVIQAYSALFPGNRIKILDHSSAGVAGAILQREAEFGISIAESYEPELERIPLLDDRFVLACRDDHPLARRRSIAWSQLEGHALIVPGPGSSNRPLLDAALAPSGLNLPFVYEVQRSSTAVGLVAQGVGAAVVPKLAVQDGTYPRIALIALAQPTVRRSFALLSRKGSVLSPAAQALYRLILSMAKPARGRRVQAG